MHCGNGVGGRVGALRRVRDVAGVRRLVRAFMLRTDAPVSKCSRAGRRMVLGGGTFYAASVCGRVSLLQLRKLIPHPRPPSFAPSQVIFVLKRTEKLLCAIAAGKWLLRQSWASESASAGAWLAESSHELFEADATCALGRSTLWLGAPRLHRLRWEATAAGAFSGFSF
eukprot:4620031-Pleurochrysis_carterae.AAC.1